MLRTIEVFPFPDVLIEGLRAEIAARSQQQEIQKEAASQHLLSTDKFLAGRSYIADVRVIY